jgi:hypothetical protein
VCYFRLTSGPSMKQIDPYAILIHADEFRLAAFKLAEHVQGIPQMAFPATVYFAFSLELYLKCLITIEGNAPKPTHNAQELVLQLSRESQQFLEDKFDNPPPESLKQRRSVEAITGQKQTFEAALRTSRNTFKTLRYIYEGKLPSDEQWNGGEIIRGARARILELKPNWPKEMHVGYGERTKRA